jgi:hypothetical protein
MRGAKKFRHVGIEPSLFAKYDIMFANIVATGEYACPYKDSYQMKMIGMLLE